MRKHNRRRPSVEALLRAGVRLLAETSESPRLDAEVSARPRARLHPDRAVQRPHGSACRAQICGRFLAMIRSRQAGRPVAQLTGHREFWSLDLAVTPDVLTPRPETETAGRARARPLAGRGPDQRGARARSRHRQRRASRSRIASERPDCEIVATDLSLRRPGGGAPQCRHRSALRVRFVAGRLVRGGRRRALRRDRVKPALSSPTASGRRRGRARLRAARGARRRRRRHSMRSASSSPARRITCRPAAGCCSSTAPDQGPAVRELLAARRPRAHLHHGRSRRTAARHRGVSPS